MTSPRRGPDISAAQVAGSALAAVSAAVVASFLGVGGTVIGAALGSVVASVGGAVYSHSFRHAGSKLGETKVLTVVTSRRTADVEPGPSDVPVIESEDAEHPPYAESAPAEAGPEQVEPEDPVAAGPLPPPGGRAPRWLSWKAAVALTVVAFVVAIAAIQVFELVIGRPISGGSGGTTISHLVKPGTTKHNAPAPTPKPTPSPPAVTPTGGPTATSTPTSTPTGTPTSTPTGTASPTSTATGIPTG